MQEVCETRMPIRIPSASSYTHLFNIPGRLWLENSSPAEILSRLELPGIAETEGAAADIACLAECALVITAKRNVSG